MLSIGKIIQKRNSIGWKRNKERKEKQCNMKIRLCIKYERGSLKQTQLFKLKISSSQKALLLFQENLNWDAKKKTLPDGSHSYSLFIICVIIFISYSYKHDEFM